MNWLFPGFLGGAVLIGLPIVLHLLRRKPRDEVRFPSLRFLGESALRDTRRHRLLRWLTLLLRCLAIALLCAAFARPFFGPPPAASRRAVVITLDNSMSQQTQGRWDKTRDWSLRQLEELHPGDQAALLLMEPEPAWLVPMTEDLNRVRTALAAARPGYDKTRYARPLRMAGEALAKTDAGVKILAWAADEQRAGWRGTDLAQTLPPGIQFNFMDPQPAPERQAAIIAVRQSSATKGLDVVIRQYHQTPDQRVLTVTANGRAIAMQTVSLRAGDNKINLFCDWPAETPGMRISLNPDDLPADDTVWLASVTVAATNMVLLDAVSETDFLAHALRATQKVAGPGAQPEPLPNGPWPAGSAVVLRDEASFREPILSRLNRFYEAGGAVWIFANGSPAQTDWLRQHGVRITARTPAEEPWHLRDWDATHPALAAFAGQSLLPLLEVEFYRGFNLAGDTLAPVANWPDGKTAMGEAGTGADTGQRLFITGFPLDRAVTDWPAQSSFVPFAHCAARWLGAFRETHADWHVGDTISLPEDQGTWRALDTPDPQPELTVAGNVRPAMPGLYEFVGRTGKKVFAVNPPVEESDLAPWPNAHQLAALESPLPPQASHHTAVPSAAWAAAESQQRLWWWLLLAGAVVLMAELSLANRTSR